MSEYKKSMCDRFESEMSWEEFKYIWGTGLLDELNMPVRMYHFNKRDVKITIWQPRKEAIYQMHIVDGYKNWKQLRRWYLKTKKKLLKA
jgi:hypothetical protein